MQKIGKNSKEQERHENRESELSFIGIKKMQNGFSQIDKRKNPRYDPAQISEESKAQNRSKSDKSYKTVNEQAE